VNNASAIYFSPVESTPVKKFDLAMTINTRGTFLCSKHCIPHLKKAQNPHILTLSPPLDMGGRGKNWFSGNTGYVLAKYGMTLLTHGMSEELSDYGIGCNTLWPKTLIATAAIKYNEFFGGDPTINRSRTPEIMGDAAYEILTSDSKLTNNKFFCDDEVMASVGVQDLTKYQVNPKLNISELLPDGMC
jgi:citronellol/citronellal dehydrogenase